MMKILHLCLGAVFIDNHSYQENMLPKYHALLGNEVKVIASVMTFDKNGKDSFLLPSENYDSGDGYKVTRLGFKKTFGAIDVLLRRYEKTYESLADEEPDVIFVHGSQFWDIRQVVKYKKNHTSVRVYVDNHADFFNSSKNWISKNILHKIIWRHCARSIEPYADKFYGVTPGRCDFLKDVYNISPGKIELLVMGADDEKIMFDKKTEIRKSIRESLNISKDDFLIITGGKINERKNIHLLIEAVTDISLSNVKLIVFGTPALSMKNIFENMSKSDRIRNIGWIESEKVYDYFLASDLAVFPGTHSVLWEQAVGTGTPCVFKYWKGMNHIDLNGNCKFLYKDDKTEIIMVLESIISDRDEYLTMKKCAEENGIREFSYRDISRRALKI
jgi:glycosyltransferase involved in cell wall biosynthesis